MGGTARSGPGRRGEEYPVTLSAVSETCRDVARFLSSAGREGEKVIRVLNCIALPLAVGYESRCPP
jgi:hypothetical protein